MNNASTPEARASLFDRLQDSVTHTPGDPTLSILRAHLVFEEALREFLALALPHAGALKGARLTFAQLLAVSRASAAGMPPDAWEWTAVGKLNGLRNDLAHRLDAVALAQKVEEFIAYVVANTLPMPPPELKAGDPGPLYLAIDMANAVLIGALARSLGLKF